MRVKRSEFLFKISLLVLFFHIMITNVPTDSKNMQGPETKDEEAVFSSSQQISNAMPIIQRHVNDTTEQQLVLLQSEEQLEVETSDDIKIATFNIHTGLNPHGQVDLDAIAREIEQMDIDVIALQEVDSYVYRSGFQDQSKLLSEKLDMYLVYGEAINILGIKYGNAILTKHPIIHWKNTKMRGVKEPRGLLKSKIDIKGTHYNIFVTHLGLSAGEREEQISSLNNQLSTHDSNIILMGDFNAERHFPEMQLLDVRMKDTAVMFDKQNENTFPYYGEGDDARVRIDYIFVTGDIPVTDYKVVQTKISDHHKVLITIKNMEQQ